MTGCFTRSERNGIHLLFPLEGPRAHMPLLVNQTVYAVYQDVVAGHEVHEIARAYCRRADAVSAAAPQGAHSASPPTRARMMKDVFSVLMHLKEAGLCELSEDDLIQLLPTGRMVSDATQIVPLGALDELSSFLRAARANTKQQIFFASPPLAAHTADYFDRNGLMRRHLTGVETVFVHANHAGQIVAATLVQGFSGNTAPVRLRSLMLCRPEDGAPSTVAGTHLRKLCDLLADVTLAPLVRFQFPDWEAGSDVHPEFLSVLASAGFRRAFHLSDEVAAGHGVMAYDRPLRAGRS